MKNKKGFTLVELLAVIAILAILVIIALPNVMGMFNEAKKNSFMTEVKQIYKVAQQTWISDSMMNTSNQVYSRCKTCTGKSLLLTGRQQLDYYIKLDKSGKVVQYYATDGTYQYSYNGPGLLVENITNVDTIADLPENQIIDIANNTHETSNYTLTTDRGSFDSSSDVKEIAFNLVDDGYIFKSNKLVTRDVERHETPDVTKLWFYTPYTQSEFSSGSYIKVYEDSSKNNLLLNITYNSFPQVRYSLSTGERTDEQETYYELGVYNKNNIYVEASSDLYGKHSASPSRTDSRIIYNSPIVYSIHFNGPVDNLSLIEENVEGPWITDKSVIDKIKTLKNSVDDYCNPLSYNDNKSNIRFVAIYQTCNLKFMQDSNNEKVYYANWSR